MPRPNINYAERNAKMRAEFNAYCEAHPQERFWQALRNWSGFPFIYVSQERGQSMRGKKNRAASRSALSQSS
jgi:hypothetical protein